jgi:hypothetical protein
VYWTDSGELSLHIMGQKMNVERGTAAWNLQATINLSQSAKTTIPLEQVVEPTPLQYTSSVHI